MNPRPLFNLSVKFIFMGLLFFFSTLDVSSADEYSGYGTSGQKNNSSQLNAPFVNSGNQGQPGSRNSTSTRIIQVLAGKWKDIRSSGHTIIEINADGTFSYYSDSTSSGQFANQYGDTGSWGYGSRNGTQGRWSARGTPERGTIFYQSQDGERGTLDYQVMVENGRTYWNECYFDGTLYQRQ